MHPTDGHIRGADHRLLDAEEERDALKRAHASLSARDLLESRGDDHPQAEILRQVVEEGVRSRDKLVAHNLRLAIRFSHRYRGGELDDADLMQEAVSGLMQAIDRFDPATGFRFTTYATWWIRQRCGRAVRREGRLVRIPENVEDALHKARAASVAAGGRVDPEALAAEAGVDRSRFLAAWNAVGTPRSLDVRLTTAEGEGSTLGDRIADPAPDPEQRTVSMLLAEQVRGMLDALDPWSKTVLVLRFGLDGQPPTSLRETAARLGCTHERVRQVEIEALRTLRGRANELR